MLAVPLHEMRHYVKSDMAASAGHESFAAQANASEGFPNCSPDLHIAALPLMRVCRLPNAGSMISRSHTLCESEMAASAGHGSFAAQANAPKGLVYFALN